jgi:hypothetical protein
MPACPSHHLLENNRNTDEGFPGASEKSATLFKRWKGQKEPAPIDLKAGSFRPGSPEKIQDGIGVYLVVLVKLDETQKVTRPL